MRDVRVTTKTADVLEAIRRLLAEIRKLASKGKPKKVYKYEMMGGSNS